MHRKTACKKPEAAEGMEGWVDICLIQISQKLLIAFVFEKCRFCVIKIKTTLMIPTTLEKVVECFKCLVDTLFVRNTVLLNEVSNLIYRRQINHLIITDYF